MTGARYLIGDTTAVLAQLPDASVDLVLTSPPFLALRSYLPADHAHKSREMGAEATPADYLDALLDVVEGCRRVLAPHGSMCVELGDTYWGARGYGAEGSNPLYGQRGDTRWLETRVEKNFKRTDDLDWPESKSLCMIPALFAASLAYGRNLLRPERPTPRWRIRNQVVWCRPNPPVGRLADKVRPATSYLTVACTARDRYFDLDAVRREPAPATQQRGTNNRRRRGTKSATSPTGSHGRDFPLATGCHPAGAPPLDYWVIPTQPYRGAHYATWPEALCDIPVKAMCPARVCTVCGQPSRRVVDSARVRLHDGTLNPPRVPPTRNDAADGTTGIGVRHGIGVINTTVGWTDCGHDSWRSGVVLDPFAGSGTTLAVAVRHGRDAVGIDIDERNTRLARQRVGPLLLRVEDRRPPAGGVA